MNPFTESTVARPLSEPRRQAANDAASKDEQAPPAGGSSVATAPAPRAARGRRLVRDPRSLRLARWRARNAGRGASKVARISAQCRRVTGAVLAAVLAVGVSAAWAVNVNTADAQQLESITGIGPKTAQTIIEERSRGGSFDSFDDLAERVKGIGPKKAQSLQAAGLTIGQGGAPAKAPVPAVQRKAAK